MLRDRVRRAGTLVGLHPDEATEAIVDFAILQGRNVAVTPCCVFSRLFPGRRVFRSTGATEPVHSYADFVRYLMTKSPHLRIARLNFSGGYRLGEQIAG